METKQTKESENNPNDVHDLEDYIKVTKTIVRLPNGADIKSVQELLGHSSLDTTQVYTHITSDYLKSEYLKNMPKRN